MRRRVGFMLAPVASHPVRLRPNHPSRVPGRDDEDCMADVALKSLAARASIPEVSAWERLKVNREWLGFWFMVPALAFLILFLAYPLGLGVWLSFTDQKIGRAGEFIGFENYEWLVGSVSDW